MERERKNSKQEVRLRKMVGIFRLHALSIHCDSCRYRWTSEVFLSVVKLSSGHVSSIDLLGSTKFPLQSEASRALGNTNTVRYTCRGYVSSLPLQTNLELDRFRDHHAGLQSRTKTLRSYCCYIVGINQRDIP